jgi:branched-chain amino acid transport system ATP-binding protein
MFFAVRGLHAGSGSASVLHGIELTVEKGEMVALVGANGAGKSTLLKVISGLIRQTSGTIEYEGEALPASTAARVRAGVAQVPEGRQVFADLTIEENLRLGAYSQLGSLSESDVQGRVEAVCSIFRILTERM